MFRFGAALALATITALPAAAATIDAEQMLSQFTTIALGNLDAQSNGEGPVYVGGNLASNGYDANNASMPQATLDGRTGVLFVGGNVTGNPVNVKNGNAIIGGTQTAALNMNGGGAIVHAAVPSADVRAAFQTLSLQLAGYATTPGASVQTADQNNKALTSGAGGTGALANVSVLNLTAGQAASFLGGGNLSSLSITPGVTMIVNVAGTSHNITGNFNQINQNVLFNFYQATSLTFGSSFGFSALAPLAQVQLGGSGINGTLVGNNIVNRAETKKTFTGDLPPLTPPAPPEPVPLPAAGFLLIGALAGLGALHRRAS